VANVSEPRVIVSDVEPVMTATVPPECDVCNALAKEWDQNRDRDVLIEINNHPHSDPKLSRVNDWTRKGASVG
jgi:hypothetical protein